MRRKGTHYPVIRPEGLDARLGNRVSIYGFNWEGVLEKMDGIYYVSNSNMRYPALHSERLNFEDGVFLVDLI